MHALLQRIIQKLDSGEWRIIGDETVPDWLRALAAQQYQMLSVELVRHADQVYETSWDGTCVCSEFLDRGTSTLHVRWRDGDVACEALVVIDRCGKKKEDGQ